MAFVLLRILAATSVAVGGILLGFLLGHVSAVGMNLLVYSALGALSAVTAADVLPDAKQMLSWPGFLTAAGSGYALFWLIGKHVCHICPACAIAHRGEGTVRRLGPIAVLLMVALGIHSTMDGIALVVADAVTRRPDVGVLFGVSFHKLPEGLALILLLIGAGYKRRTALVWALAIESTTVFGGVLGVLALRWASLPWLAWLFGHIGGGFLYLVTNAFWAPSVHHRRLPEPPLMIASVVTFAITSLLLWTIRQYGG
jgi:zinc transporter ZupT